MTFLTFTFAFKILNFIHDEISMQGCSKRRLRRWQKRIVSENSKCKVQNSKGVTFLTFTFAFKILNFPHDEISMQGCSKRRLRRWQKRIVSENSKCKVQKGMTPSIFHFAFKILNFTHNEISMQGCSKRRLRRWQKRIVSENSKCKVQNSKGDDALNFSFCI